ncbi:hypothetical protein WME94_07175 [Sorangium sp. So ce429]
MSPQIYRIGRAGSLVILLEGVEEVYARRPSADRAGPWSPCQPTGTARDPGDPGHVCPQDGLDAGQVGSFNGMTQTSAPPDYLQAHGGTGDHNVDSLVLLDSFRWNVTPSAVQVHNEPPRPAAQGGCWARSTPTA